MGAGMSSFGDSRVNPGFLRERLETAAAVPASQCTPEVAGFVESCCLRDEAAALVAQPLPPSAPASERARRAVHESLLLVKADHLCAGAPLDFYHAGSKTAKVQELRELASTHIATGGLPRSTSVEAAIFDLVDSMGREQAAEPGALPPSLGLLLLITATLQPPPVVSQMALVARLLRLLLQPEVARSLDAQLEEAQRGLPAPLLSLEELAGRVAEHAAQCCTFASVSPSVLRGDTGATACVVETASVCQAVLPLLAAARSQPPIASLRLRWGAVCAAALVNPSEQAGWSTETAALADMRGAGSDYYVALVGFMLGMVSANMIKQVSGTMIKQVSATMIKQGAVPPDSPAEVLSWVQQAEAAYQRCKRLLPSVWVANIKHRRGPAMAACPWLESLAAAGNGWVAAPHAEAVEAVDRGFGSMAELASDPNRGLRCAACGAAALHLRTCSGCRQAAYCSKRCQLEQWPQHKHACKARQKARTAARAGSSSTGTGTGTGPVGSTGAVGSPVDSALAGWRLAGWLLVGWLTAAGAGGWAAGWGLAGWLLAAWLLSGCWLASRGWQEGKNRREG